MKDKQEIHPSLSSDGTKWFIRIGNAIYSEKWRSDNIIALASLAPIVFWVIASIVLHKLGTRNFLEPSFIYPALFGPFFTFIPIVAIARRLSDKIYGDYYTERGLGWNSKTASEYYQEAIAKMDHIKARQLVIHAMLTIVSGLLIGWVTGVAGFLILVY